MTKDDKETVDVTDLSTYASILENAGNIKSAIDSMARKTDKAYSNAIKQINDLEKDERTKKFDTLDQTEKNKYETKDDQGNGTGKYDEDAFKEAGKNASKVLNAVSSAMSTVQGLHNTYMNSWKTVVKERDTVYKQLIVAGLSNDRKNKKNK